MPVLVAYLGAALVGLAVTLVVVGVGRRTTHGVAALTRAGVAPAPPARATPAGRSLALRLAALAQGLLPRRRTMTGARADRVRARLDRAGLAMPAEALLALKVAGIGVGLLVGLLTVLAFGPGASAGLVVVLVAGAVGYAAPDLYVLNTAQRRQRQIERAVPETLDLLALTAQAGLGLEQGVAEVSGELPGPLGAELDRFLKEQQLGVDRQQALRGLVDRNSCDDLRTFALALMQADQLGTPISATLQVQAREMRRRRRARARERAGKAPVKLLFPLIFGIFPALFVIIMGPGALAIIESMSR